MNSNRSSYVIFKDLARNFLSNLMGDLIQVLQKHNFVDSLYYQRTRFVHTSPATFNNIDNCGVCSDAPMPNYPLQIPHPYPGYPTGGNILRQATLLPVYI